MGKYDMIKKTLRKKGKNETGILLGFFSGYTAYRIAECIRERNGKHHSK